MIRNIKTVKICYHFNVFDFQLNFSEAFLWCCIKHSSNALFKLEGLRSIGKFEGVGIEIKNFSEKLSIISNCGENTTHFQDNPRGTASWHSIFVINSVLSFGKSVSNVWKSILVSIFLVSYFVFVSKFDFEYLQLSSRTKNISNKSYCFVLIRNKIHEEGNERARSWSEWNCNHSIWSWASWRNTTRPSRIVRKKQTKRRTRQILL